MKIGKYYLSTVLVIIVLLCNVQTLSPQCQACHFIVQTIQKLAPISPLDKIIQVVSIAYCTKKHVQDHDICKGSITQMMDPIVNSIWKRYTDPHQICHDIYMCPQQYFIRNLTEELQNIIKDTPNKTWQKATNRKSLRIMHISDLHPDWQYTPGSEANCTQPQCCRPGVPNGNLREQIKIPAGYWGSIAACDIPIHTIDLFLEQVKKLNLDFIIWTGDNTAHDIWKQSQPYNINFTTVLSQKIRNALPNVTVLPSMGNHESFPVNVYDYDGKRQDVLKKSLADSWRQWIGQKGYNMMKQKGWYSYEFDKLNLKVISINTQASNPLNWFLIKNPTDPGHMLDWIHSELQASQAKNQLVYIIGHIPPNNIINDWSVRYNAIVQRFSYTIRGQFYGHTHNDHIGIHYNTGFNTTDHITNYYFVAPSITTSSHHVPEYRILDIDLDTFQVKDFHQYRLDLRKFQKKQDSPKFEILYHFKQAYGLDDMRPDSGMRVFVQKLKTDPATQIKYSHYRNGGLAAGAPHLGWYCNTFATPQQQNNCGGKSYEPGIVEKLGGEWRDLRHK